MNFANHNDAMQTKILIYEHVLFEKPGRMDARGGRRMARMTRRMALSSQRTVRMKALEEENARLN